MKKKTFQVPKVVELFQKDASLLGKVNDEKGWYITEEWVKKFQNHLKNMLPLAEHGDPVAQYNVAVIYMCSYLHATEESSIANYKTDIKVMSQWLERAAKGGYVVAIDNLISTGVGSESDRLRELYAAHKNELENTPPPSEGWERDLQRLYELVYKHS